MRNLFKNFRIKRRLISLLAGIHFYGNPSTKMKIIGVTGTSGKTTTTTLLYQIAAGLGYKAGLIGTVENMIAGERVLTPEDKAQTTPDTIFLYELLNKMAQAGCQYVFMEVSSHALDQNRVAGINFAGAVFTNLSQDHFDYHKNFDNYFRAKQKLFIRLRKNAFAISNTDDEFGKQILEKIKARKLSYGFNGGENFHGEIKKIDFNGSELIFNNNHIHSKLLGKFNAYNLLAAWSVCQSLGFDLIKVKTILENVRAPR